MTNGQVLFAGGGFSGGHLGAELGRRGRRVRTVGIKPVAEWYQADPEEEIVTAGPLRDGIEQTCRRVYDGHFEKHGK